MAAVHQVITLGIGSPADIPHFVLFGLSPTGPVAVIDFMRADLSARAPSASFTGAQPSATFTARQPTATMTGLGDS